MNKGLSIFKINQNNTCEDEEWVLCDYNKTTTPEPNLIIIPESIVDYNKCDTEVFTVNIFVNMFGNIFGWFRFFFTFVSSKEWWIF